MSVTLASVGLAVLLVGQQGVCNNPAHHHHHQLHQQQQAQNREQLHRRIEQALGYPKVGGRITPPGPGYGWGFPNGNPDGFGWVDYGTTLPLGGDRNTEYYFQRRMAMPVAQVFPSTYYNPYLTRGQRFIPFTGCGGWHPAGGPPTGSSVTPMLPYQERVAEDRQREALVPPPNFTGRVDSAPVTSGNSGLIP